MIRAIGEGDDDVISGKSRITDATHEDARRGAHIDLTKLPGVNAAHDPRSGRASSLKLTRDGRERLRAELNTLDARDRGER